MPSSIDQLANAVRESGYTVVLTGAGISTPSGIPDFRSPESGLWAHTDPFSVASLQAFRTNPQAFFDWVRPLIHTLLNADPNPAHIALAELEDMGLVHTVITQNIDSLHQRAGSRRVIELHGHARQATCTRCYATFPAESFLPAFLDTGIPPRCPRCNGILKPDVILFGEQLPRSALLEAWKAIRRCELLIVVGSSLTVAPAADMPLIARERGAILAILNLTPTPFDPLADIVIHGEASAVLSELLALIRTPQPSRGTVRHSFS